jgi:hypothetical protein
MKEHTMTTARFASLAGLGVAAAAAVLTLTAPLATAHPLPANAQNLCEATAGTFAGDAYQGHGRCTYTVLGHTHHLYYNDGRLIGSD